MRLKKITLKNFRCFEHLEIDLHPRLTVFVGENGAGKTTVLDGIATAISPILTYLSSANQRLVGRRIEDADFRLESWAGRGGKERRGVADFVQIQVETWDGLAWDYWRPSTAGKKPSKKIGTTELKKYLQAISESYKTNTPQLTPVIAYYGVNRGHIKVPKRLRSARENYDYPAAALIGALDSLSDFREMLAWFDQEESAELRANKGVANDDFEASLALTAVRVAVVELLGNAYHSPHFSKEHKFTLIRKSDDARLMVNQLSQGYQSMLALAMDFSRRLAIANGHLSYDDDVAQKTVFDEVIKLETIDPSYNQQVETPFQEALAMSAPAIMLVDEIDLHLHPLWQQRVLTDLMNAFPLTQFIVTTHSPQVLSTVRRENIRILRQTENGIEAAIPDFSPLAHESGDALAKVMNTPQQPPLNDLLEKVRNFEQLVLAGQENSEVAQALRQALDSDGYQIHDSSLATWRFLAKHKTQQGV